MQRQSERFTHTMNEASKRETETVSFIRGVTLELQRDIGKGLLDDVLIKHPDSHCVSCSSSKTPCLSSPFKTTTTTFILLDRDCSQCKGVGCGESSHHGILNASSYFSHSPLPPLIYFLTLARSNNRCE